MRISLCNEVVFALDFPARTAGLVLVGHGRRGRTGRHELLPAGLGGTGPGRVAIVLGGALLHDLHVAVEPALLVLPPLEVVSELLLALGARLGERPVRALRAEAPGSSR